MIFDFLLLISYVKMVGWSVVAQSMEYGKIVRIFTILVININYTSCVVFTSVIRLLRIYYDSRRQ